MMKARQTFSRRLIAASAAAALLVTAFAGCGRVKQTISTEDKKTTGIKQLVIAEPVHLIGYLPLYMAQREGYFREQGLDIKVIQATGGTHVTAVISGSAWGVIGGVDSNALGNKGNSDPITAVANCVNRANVYLVAKKGLAPKSKSQADLKAFLKGKKIVAGRHGGSPNLLTRYLLLQLGLNPEKDTQILEPGDAATVVSMLQNGNGEIGNGAEPQICDGIEKNVWNEPFYKFTDLGDYSYSVFGVKKSTIQNDPVTVQKFVNAILKALKAVQNDRELAEKDLKLEFPTMKSSQVKASLDRAYQDQLWSKDGLISKKAVDIDMDVLLKTGIYTGSYSYATLVDMQFVKAAKK